MGEGAELGAVGLPDQIAQLLPVVGHCLLGGQLLLQAARLEGSCFGLCQLALALEQLLFKGATTGIECRQLIAQLCIRQGGQLGVVLAIAIPLALLQCQRPLPLGKAGTRLAKGIFQSLQGRAARLEFIGSDGEQAAQVIFGNAEGTGVGSPAPQHLPLAATAGLLFLLHMGEAGLEFGLPLPQNAGAALHQLQFAGELLQPLLPAALDLLDFLATETTAAAGEQPLPLLLVLLVVPLEFVQQLALGLQACLLRAQGGGEAGDLAGQPLPLALAVQPGFAGSLPLVPLLAAEPLAPRLAAHLLIEAVGTLFEALAQGRLLLANPLYFPFQRDALAIGLLPLLVKLLVLGSQLAQLLTHPLQLLLAELGLTQQLLALGQPLLQRLATAKQGAHQLVPLNGTLAQRQRMAEQGIAPQLLPALGQLLGAGFQLRQMLLTHRQLAGQLLTLALALDVLMIEPIPFEFEASGPLRQLTQDPRHLWLALAVGVLPGTAQRARFTIAQDMAILLEAGDGAGLLQRVARLIPLQGEPLAGGGQLFA